MVERGEVEGGGGRVGEGEGGGGDVFGGGEEEGAFALNVLLGGFEGPADEFLGDEEERLILVGVRGLEMRWRRGTDEENVLVGVDLDGGGHD